MDIDVAPGLAADGSEVIDVDEYVEVIQTIFAYTYRPLETTSSIRVIEILAGLVSGNIACKIHHIDTVAADAPAHFALSYLWGDSTLTNTITIISEDNRHCTHHIHHSLWCFLYQVWDTKATERLYWTDFLSINQDDNAERGHQVARMGHVYKEAEQVLIWLGQARS